ncbi:MAG TPA: 2-C-methyl-D-erythritol 4-phosphate cytidylyltransferase [Syntrophales bacterium]|nr:2-C-methyl-D-erythritol 4-phosphate cytidylyltransferase [Syntrophales bacterium]
MRTVAIVPAAGSGNRMGRDLFKQYLSLGGMPLLVHTLNVFEECPLVDGLLVVVPPGDIEFVRNTILAPRKLKKVAGVIAGGKERQDSVRAGVEALGRETELVIVHDAVRPFITVELISQCILAAWEEGAVTAGVPVKDTVKEVSPDGRVMKTCDRSQMWLTQTPQAFRREIIENAHRAAARDGFRGTDDSSLVERLGIAVRMIRGEYGNIKITTPDDLILAETLLTVRRGSR